ncbi:MAG: hypothetical protein QMD10_09925 [Desulfitobacteriaceae bacterium]|nr:hypothetical protein [Desulfitobacteriaceae bacterium]
MGKITELTVSRGRTRRPGDAEEWIREEYTLKAVLDDEAELEAAKAQMEGIIIGWLTGQAAPAKPPTAQNILPEDLAGMVSFEEQADAVIIRPKAYLGAENFAKIAAIVRKHGGEYISAGKESHFRMPKTAAK